MQAAVPLTLAVGLGAAPLALTTDTPGAAHQMEVRVTPKIHPGSVQGWEVPTRQEHLPIFQHQIRLGADSDCGETGRERDRQVGEDSFPFREQEAQLWVQTHKHPTVQEVHCKKRISLSASNPPLALEASTFPQEKKEKHCHVGTQDGAIST